MKKILLAGVAGLVLVGSTAVYAQHRPWSHHQSRMNPEDRAAFADARIAAVHVGLKLTPDQEKLWPPVEAAVKDFAKLRIDRANARMDERRKGDDARGPETPDNPVARLQQRADDMATTAAALKKIAETADPLYKTLDEGQKRRLAVLTHMRGEGFGGGHMGMRHRGFERGMDRMGDGDRDGGGMDRERMGRGMDHDRGPGPDRL